ncbi:helix-turn-helix domain-containing protein [Streptomyces scopuliridis]|uniref:Helix-turn-helix domain-containing protein n=1 Tax=Streptomyces scopuliridis TaxID=452529 RepID=A0ACD4ZY21_9ACTN|nr:helix-turn-helix domain-containing protein [Streptomyces scopuliridis]WSB38355.1 helix-turn-helix domain-containing protein [Streptomyces scopuliridis]WSC02799.1 helix-turn-helix domain-containing protein [Streptomyces scopuliridis]WSC03667.1 helix-turn-helix domain-containing protein [Streptomyces scopuliridis]
MPEPTPKTGKSKRAVHLSDPRALRAYAHPTRMKLVGLLRVEGPFTATRASVLTGESVASCSYHLRMLAKYGLVEQAEGGQGREKPWRATARYTTWEGAGSEAAEVLDTAVTELYFERITHAIETRRQLPREWREAERFGDEIVYLTAAELAELEERVSALLDSYGERFDDPSRRPEGAEPVTVMRIAFRNRREEAS